MIQTLVSRILSLHLPAGIAVDRIVGYGSYFWGGYCPGTSDIDLAVIMCRMDGQRLSANDINDIRTLLDASCLVVDHIEIETYRRMPISIYGKILGCGVVLYANDETQDIRDTAAALALPYASARDRWVRKCREDARALLADVMSDEQLLRGPPSRIFRVAADAQRAALLMLWSVLYEADIDPSDKSVRWDLGKLIKMAATLRPKLSSLIRYAKGLPSEPIAKIIGYCNNRETRRIVRIAKCLLAMIDLTDPRGYWQ